LNPLGRKLLGLEAW